MKKNKILKTIQQKEDDIIDAVEELKEFLYSTEDPMISEMGVGFYDFMVDILHENDNISLNEIREFVEEEYEEQ